jgi:hypothetical protein
MYVAHSNSVGNREKIVVAATEKVGRSKYRKMELNEHEGMAMLTYSNTHKNSLSLSLSLSSTPWHI